MAELAKAPVVHYRNLDSNFIADRNNFFSVCVAFEFKSERLFYGGFQSGKVLILSTILF
jgi:hypothetical protein